MTTATRPPAAPPGVAGDPSPRRADPGRVPHALPRLGHRLRRPARVRRDRTTRGTSTGTRPPGSNEPQVRQFTEDRDLTVWLVLDRSASMTIGAPGRGKHDVLAELALVLARLFGRGGNRVGALLLRRRHAPGSCRPAPAAATRCASATNSTAPSGDRAGRHHRLRGDAGRRRVAGPAPVADHRRLRLHRHRRVGQAAAAPRPSPRRRRAAGDRRRRRRAARGRPDRRRGRRDRRAAARRLQRPAVPRPVPGRRRRARRGARPSGCAAPACRCTASTPTATWSRRSSRSSRAPAGGAHELRLARVAGPRRAGRRRAGRRRGRRRRAAPGGAAAAGSSPRGVDASRSGCGSASPGSPCSRWPWPGRPRRCR